MQCKCMVMQQHTVKTLSQHKQNHNKCKVFNNANRYVNIVRNY
jgi:hypothetical protein